MSGVSTPTVLRLVIGSIRRASPPDNNQNELWVAVGGEKERERERKGEGENSRNRMPATLATRHSLHFSRRILIATSVFNGGT